MKNTNVVVLSFIFSFSTFSAARATTDLPSKFVDLLPYVQQGPDQGRTGTCLFVGSTGAMELVANKANGIKRPKPYGPYDLSEAFLISQEDYPETEDKLFIEKAVLKFNWGYGVLAKDWEFDVWNGSSTRRGVWTHRDVSKLPHVELPKIETIVLFAEGDRWSREVLDDTHIEQIKEALYKYKAPVLISYNDSGFWHVISIVGYDDQLPGNCYQIDEEICREDKGAFYVRDSFGLSVELRDYDWMRLRGNHAVVVKEAE